MTINAWFDPFVPQGASVLEGALHRPGEQAQPSPSCALVPLLSLARVVCEGEEATPFLHSLCSNDIKALSQTQLQWNSFNTPKGRMLANFLVRQNDTPTALCLYTHAGLANDLAARLSRYVLRAKARVSLPSETPALFGLCGETAAHTLAQHGLPVPAALSWAQAGDTQVLAITPSCFILECPLSAVPERLAQWVGPNAATLASGLVWDRALIAAGVFWLAPALQEAFVAQMLNYELIGGVSFQKGCYPGQEIIARTRYLGKVKKRLFRVSLSADAAPAIGDAVVSPVSGEQSAGKLIAVAPVPGGFEALAVAPVSCAREGTLRLRQLDGPALTRLDLPYAVDMEA
jgi:tRNA-modifying protein YgfZ